MYKPSLCGRKIIIINLVKSTNGDFGRHFTHYAMDNGSFNSFSFMETALFLVFSATLYPTY
jgi:hypothetical protein